VISHAVARGRSRHQALLQHCSLELWREARSCSMTRVQGSQLPDERRPWRSGIHGSALARPRGSTVSREKGETGATLTPMRPIKGPPLEFISAFYRNRPFEGDGWQGEAEELFSNLALPRWNYERKVVALPIAFLIGMRRRRGRKRERERERSAPLIEILDVRAQFPLAEFKQRFLISRY